MLRQVLLNQVLRRIFGKQDEVNSSVKNKHNEKLQSLYSSVNTMRVIKFKRMRCMIHADRIRKVLVGKPQGKQFPLVHIIVHGKIILKRTGY
jgi:hypothetical protein